MTQNKPHQKMTGWDDIDEEIVMMTALKQALSYQAKQALVERIRPQYRDASRAQKTTILDAFVKLTGYTRKSALRMLNQPPGKPGPITRDRDPLYGPHVLEALVLAWKATQYICARRLVPSLPTLRCQTPGERSESRNVARLAG